MECLLTDFFGKYNKTDRCHLGRNQERNITVFRIVFVNNSDLESVALELPECVEKMYN